MLADAFPNYAINEVSNTQELCQDPHQKRPNFIIFYIRSEPFSDAVVQRSLDFFREHEPGVPIVLLSDRIEFEEMNKVLTSGVRGYIPTSVGYDVAMAALKLVEAGGTYVPADALCNTHLTNRAAQAQNRDMLNLTPREHSVFELMRDGSPNKVIASRLQMQETTVKVHVRNILRKLRATNRTHAVSIGNKLCADSRQNEIVGLADKKSGRTARDPLGR
jgi:DNA-binding NarL/FixJ family response regulator